jgi:multiple sugar transport system permease protein
MSMDNALAAGDGGRPPGWRPRTSGQPAFTVSPHAKRGGLKGGEARMGLMMLAPALIAFSAVILYPFLKALGLSFFEYTITTPAPVYVGLANYREVFSNPNILSSFFTTLIYVALATAGTMFLGLAWALIVNQPFPGRGLVRSISLMPWLLPSTVSAFLWAWIFNSRFGLLNAALMEVGMIERPEAWLSTAPGAMTAIVLTKVWLSIPLFMAFFLAGLQSLDKEQLEAARIDGAGNFALLRDHVLPHLKPVLMVVIVLGMIGNLQQFDTIFALTGGGPVRATTVLSIEVYRSAFEQWDLGMAATVGALWVATIVPPAYFYLRELLKGS